MIDNLTHVPPALMLLLSEMEGCDSFHQMRKRIKGMLTDLRDQSEAYEISQIRESRMDKSDGLFEIHLHGAMDLLTRQSCNSPACRVSSADRISRSVGLLADRVWITDLLTERFVDFGRPTNAKLDSVLEDLLVLSRLLPLIKAGIIKFRSPLMVSCSSCFDEFNQQVEAASKHLTKTFYSEFKIQKENGGYVAYTGNCLEPPLLMQGILSDGEKSPTKKQFSEYWVEEQVRSTFWIAREAALTGGVVVSNSRIGLAGLLQQEGRLADSNSLYLLDRERELNVPWVSELNAHQIVELRQEASKALPLFREKLFHAMSASSKSTQSPHDLVFELREQAAEVRAELSSTQKNSAKFWKATYGILGMGLCVYGVATDQVATSVGGLLPLLQLLIDHKAGHEANIDAAIGKPGYVLLKAQDILSHAHE